MLIAWALFLALCASGSTGSPTGSTPMWYLVVRQKLNNFTAVDFRDAIGAATSTSPSQVELIAARAVSHQASPAVNVTFKVVGIPSSSVSSLYSTLQTSVATNHTAFAPLGGADGLSQETETAAAPPEEEATARHRIVVVCVSLIGILCFFALFTCAYICISKWRLFTRLSKDLEAQASGGSPAQRMEQRASSPSENRPLMRQSSMMRSKRSMRGTNRSQRAAAIDDRPLLNPEQISTYQTAFNLFDIDGDGTISAAELGILLGTAGQNFSISELEDMVNEYDSDHNGNLCFSEFVYLMNHLLDGQHDLLDIELARARLEEENL